MNPLDVSHDRVGLRPAALDHDLWKSGAHAQEVLGPANTHGVPTDRFHDRLAESRELPESFVDAPDPAVAK